MVAEIVDIDGEMACLWVMHAGEHLIQISKVQAFHHTQLVDHVDQVVLCVGIGARR
jgi:hypothetical protein